MMAIGRQRMGAMQRRMERTAWLFLLPSLVCFLIYMAFPLLDSLALSFFKRDGLSAKKFIGFDN